MKLTFQRRLCSYGLQVASTSTVVHVINGYHVPIGLLLTGSAVQNLRSGQRHVLRLVICFRLFNYCFQLPR